MGVGGGVVVSGREVVVLVREGGVVVAVSVGESGNKLVGVPELAEPVVVVTERKMKRLTKCKWNDGNANWDLRDSHCCRMPSTVWTSVAVHVVVRHWRRSVCNWVDPQIHAASDLRERG